MNEQVRSRFGLFFIFTLSVFMIILFSAILTALTALLLLHYGFLKNTFYQNPSIGLIYIVLMSLIIGLIVTALCSKVILEPIRKVLFSMKSLAGGNFNTRIKTNGLFKPKELIEFSEEFNSMAEELGSIEMLRSDFVNNFSHEFKTPIVSLRGFAKLLKEKNLTPEEKEEYLDIIINESDRLAVLATNVLNLSKIEKQSIITDMSTYDLSEQIRRTILIMESKWGQKELVLDVELDEISFYGNQELLSQVWVNLIDNAIKFSTQGGELQIKLIDFYDSAVIMIKDSGCGMDETTKTRIFDKFYQGDTSHTSEGNGLGLTLVKKIIELHQGNITVDSDPGQGTMITVALPKRQKS